MNGKTKIFISFGCALLIIICALVLNITFNTNPSEDSDKKAALNVVSENRVKVSFSENSASDDKLKKLSDIIIKGTVKKLKEKSIKSCETTSSNNEKVTVDVPVAIYDIDVREDIKGVGNAPKELELALTDPNIDLEIGNDYTFVLYKIKGNSALSGSYALVSYYQGIYKFDENTQELISPKTKEKIKFNDFKNRFKENK